MKIELAALRPHPQNYNRHPAAQIEKIKRSLARFGQRKPITTWRGFVLTGHGVFEAARSLGWSEIWAEPCPEEWTEAEALERWATMTGQTPVLVDVMNGSNEPDKVS